MEVREIQAGEVTSTVRKLCIEANTVLGDDVLEAFEKGLKNEKSPMGQDVFRQLLENAKIAREEGIPLCQDTGLVIVFVELGQDVHLVGGDFREAAHERLVELITRGEELPFDLTGQIIYYVGPTPPKPGMTLGSAGPTTSYRMDPYAPALMAKGLKGMIGKGARGRDVLEAMQRYKALYFVATGGAGALISKKIKTSEIVAYEDLGPEAIRKMDVKDFPAIVANDIYGNALYAEGKKRYGKSCNIR